jgi:nitrite reductase/ring-hydroxylating ferredoxin subunit
MNAERLLCRLSDIPDGQARGLLREGLDDRLCVVRQGGQVFAWLNDCPHEHRPMEYRQDRFLSADGRHLVCHAHAALFEIQTGRCVAGPCRGEHLVAVPARVIDGKVWIPAELPHVFD